MSSMRDAVGTGLLVLVLFLLASPSQAMDPPEKLWEKLYDEIEELYDTELVPDGGIVCAGYDLAGNCLFRFDADGNLLWSAGDSWVWRGEDVEALSDGSFIVTGADWVITDSDGRLCRYTTALFVQKCTGEGAVVWTREYGGPDTLYQGFGVTGLPDGGFAVCGQTNGQVGSSAGQAWILRTDSNGDTLWTDVWGTYPMNFARRAIYDEELDLLVVAAFGKSDDLPTNGPHLLYYDLDGACVAGTDYPSLGAEVVRGFCASADGGYAILSRYGEGQGAGTLTHTDAYGEILWSESIEGMLCNDNLGLSMTPFDGGYLCTGWDGQFIPWQGAPGGGPPGTDDPATQDGWLTRYDADGEWLWGILNEIGAHNRFYSGIQLPEGGYVAAGTHTSGAYLVRYGPETGMEPGEPEPGALLSAFPNPFRGSVTMVFELAEPTHASLRVYDLSARLIETPFDGEAPLGPMSCWLDGSRLPAGVYLARLQAGDVSATIRLVKL